MNRNIECYLSKYPTRSSNSSTRCGIPSDSQIAAPCFCKSEYPEYTDPLNSYIDILKTWSTQDAGRDRSNKCDEVGK
jgi:hypothetical protein